MPDRTERIEVVNAFGDKGFETRDVMRVAGLGYKGAGVFCTLRCGYEFAMASFPRRVETIAKK